MAKQLQVKRAKNVNPSLDVNTISLVEGEPLYVEKTDGTKSLVIGSTSSNTEFKQVNVVNTTGTSATDAISQKAATDAINAKVDTNIGNTNLSVPNNTNRTLDLGTNSTITIGNQDSSNLYLNPTTSKTEIVGDLGVNIRTENANIGTTVGGFYLNDGSIRNLAIVGDNNTGELRVGTSNSNITMDSDGNILLSSGKIEKPTTGTKLLTIDSTGAMATDSTAYVSDIVAGTNISVSRAGSAVTINSTDTNTNIGNSDLSLTSNRKLSRDGSSFTISGGGTSMYNSKPGLYLSDNGAIFGKLGVAGDDQNIYGVELIEDDGGIVSLNAACAVQCNILPNPYGNTTNFMVNVEDPNGNIVFNSPSLPKPTGSTITPIGINSSGNVVLSPTPAVGQYMYFAHTATGSGDGSSWANAKAFSVANYDSMPANTAALLLGDGTKKYLPGATINVVAGKPIYGGFIGNGLLQEEPAIVEEDSIWSEVRFSKYASILDGQGIDRVALRSYGGYVSGLCIGNYLNDGNYGGGMYLYAEGGSTSTATNCIVTNCIGYYGGGMYVDGSYVTNCIVTNCHSSGYYGGGMYVVGGSTVTNCTISNCGDGNGGGMYVDGSYVTNCTISNCGDGNGNGGGMHVDGSYVTNCTISNCIAEVGGGMYVAGSTSVHECSVNKCTALNTQGGGMYVADNSNVINCSVTSCYVDGDGGGIYVNSGEANSCVVSGCYTSNNGDGGGMYVNSYNGGSVNNCSVYNCYSSGNNNAPGVYPNYTGVPYHWNNTTTQS